MSSSGAHRALLDVANTFTGAQTFNAGLTSTAATVSGILATAEIVSTVVAVAAAYVVLATDEVVLADPTAAAFAVTLPNAATVKGRRVTVKKLTASVNAVTVASAGGTIDTAVSIAMATQNEALEVVSDGVNWLVVSQVAITIL